jgi:ATP-dependent RNA helicase RhlE
MKFSELGLIDPILKALQHEGYEKPTPIQEQAIPIVLSGQDLLGCAQTGTGKTAAFAIPIIQTLVSKLKDSHAKSHIKVLVLTPTRELAIQIDESFAAYGRHAGLKQAVIFGGVSQQAQTNALRRGIDILTATPGRLLDLIQQGFVDLKHIEVFVLDEADRMLDMGFIHDVRRVIQLLPQKRQTLFFSATMPPEITKLSKTILHNPKRVEVTPPSTTAETISQGIYFVTKNDKKNLLVEILKNKDIERVLVFTRTKHGANKVVKDLIKAQVTAEAIHGNKSQSARQNALKNFKNKDTRVLVATDIAARGIDVDELTHVVNYDLPNIPETYVHRIGRTGRAGSSGTAISFCDEEERAYLRDIQKLTGITIPVLQAKYTPTEMVSVEATAPKQNVNSANQDRPKKKRPSKKKREQLKLAKEKGEVTSSPNQRERQPSQGGSARPSTQGRDGNRRDEQPRKPRPQHSRQGGDRPKVEHKRNERSGDSAQDAKSGEKQSEEQKKLGWLARWRMKGGRK